MRLVVLACVTCLLAAGLVLAAASALAVQPCAIEVVEKGNAWPVPMVELRTTHNVCFVSDNAGVIAFDLPESMGRRTWFNVFSHGYEVPKDGFGGRGVKLTPEPGKTLKIEVTRTIIARRLGRLTGAGLFGESQKLGRQLDWQESGILGSDSVQVAVHGQRLFWAWGDTNLPDYWLGIFDTSSATTPLSPLRSFEPPLRLTFDYFRDPAGRPRGVAKMPGRGPTWLSGTSACQTGRASPGSWPPMPRSSRRWKPTSLGCVFGTTTRPSSSGIGCSGRSRSAAGGESAPDGHPAFWKDRAGKSWVLFGNPLPVLRMPATFEAWEDPATWEVLKPQKTLVSAGDGTTVKPHSGSIAWNEYRGRWVTVFMEAFGKPSAFGEVWYAEAPAPTGPWGKAVKVLSHRNYTFYNPRLHPELTPAKSPILLFEGTHSQTFADRPGHPPVRLQSDPLSLGLGRCGVAGGTNAVGVRSLDAQHR